MILNVGDRVRFKYDHTWKGTVKYLYPSSDKVAIYCAASVTEWIIVPAKWFELVPKPLNPLVPWWTLEHCIVQYSPSGATAEQILGELKMRGYGLPDERND